MDSREQLEGGLENQRQVIERYQAEMLAITQLFIPNNKFGLAASQLIERINALKKDRSEYIQAHLDAMEKHAATLDILVDVTKERDRLRLLLESDTQSAMLQQYAAVVDQAEQWRLRYEALASAEIGTKETFKTVLYQRDGALTKLQASEAEAEKYRVEAGQWEAAFADKHTKVVALQFELISLQVNIDGYKAQVIGLRNRFVECAAKAAQLCEQLQGSELQAFAEELRTELEKHSNGMTAKQRYRCIRCKEEVNMEEMRCGCTTSPSPWEPIQ